MFEIPDLSIPGPRLSNHHLTNQPRLRALVAVLAIHHSLTWWPILIVNPCWDFFYHVLGTVMTVVNHIFTQKMRFFSLLAERGWCILGSCGQLETAATQVLGSIENQELCCACCTILNRWQPIRQLRCRELCILPHVDDTIIGKQLVCQSNVVIRKGFICFHQDCCCILFRV